MINFANPELKLPSQKVLAGCILNTNSEYIKKSLIDIARKDELRVTVCFDGWKNVKKQEIMGSILITSDEQVLKTIGTRVVLISKYIPEEFDQEDEAIYHSD
ncbi:hypothetical protein RclHR1_00490001 [Rhizophagus clarus]|uniref:DUF659 domain-containing protein n=1 Tax=Rhizophagus clarus TaxID=94130 RepID=A0A2Z6RWX8_9GLOM|nr:hypothetical protein RclHR1_00490001 [Rhizophagus clarus]